MQDFSFEIDNGTIKVEVIGKMDEILKDTYEKYLKKWFKKGWKYLLVILLYILYQSNFLIELVSETGLELTTLPRWIRTIILVLNDLIYVFIVLYMFRNEIKKGLKEVKKDFPRLATLSLNCWIIGSLIMTTSSIIISYITKQNTSANEALVRQSIKMAPLYMLFTCSIVAPVLEEMTFRRALKGLINNKWVFILVSGLGFGLLHVIGTGFKNPLDFLYIIPYSSMGCAFAYLLTKTNNITLPIMVHMLHNTILVLMQILRR